MLFRDRSISEEVVETGGYLFSIARAPDRFTEIAPAANVRIAMTAMPDETTDV